MSDQSRSYPANESDADAWQYRKNLGSDWGEWNCLNIPIEKFKEDEKEAFEDGLYEIRPLYATPHPGPVAQGSPDPLRYCDYCGSWNSKPCGAGCVWTHNMPTVEEAKQKIITHSKRASSVSETEGRCPDCPARYLNGGCSNCDGGE